MATKKIIKSTDKVRVFKNIVGSLSYAFRNSIRSWDEKIGYKDMIISDVEEMLGQSDLYAMFNKNQLLIKDESIREFLKLDPLNNDYLDSDKIKDLLALKDAQKLEEVIETCEDSELEMIVDTAVKEKVNDRNVLGVLEDYTGLELTEDLLNNNEESKPDDTEKPVKRTKKK